MEKHHKEHKFIITVIVSLAILLSVVFGIYLLLDNSVLSSDEPVAHSKNPAKETIIPTNTITPVRNDEVVITVTEEQVKIDNISKSFSYKVKTDEYKMIINISGRTLDENKLNVINEQGIINEVSARTFGEDSIEIIISLSNNFNFNEVLEQEAFILDFYTSVNNKLFTYHNSTIKKYILIDDAKLSSKLQSAQKYYEENMSEDGLTYTIKINSSYLPNIKDEKLIYNDDYLNYIDISLSGDKTIIEFSAKKPLVYYPNTRDYDSTLTLLDVKNSSGVIIIDAGHGGSDVGAFYEGRYEKDITLAVALKTYEELVKSGYNCFLIRENDEYVGINERVDIANLLNASLLINIHANSYDDTSVNGLLTMYKDEKKLARIIQNNLIATTDANDMGLIRTTSMLITNKSLMPAVILEMGFITNTAEWNLLDSNIYQNKIAKGLSNGIIEYLTSD